MLTISQNVYFHIFEREKKIIHQNSKKLLLNGFYKRIVFEHKEILAVVKVYTRIRYLLQ